MYSSESQLTFWSNISPPSSGLTFTGLHRFILQKIEQFNNIYSQRNNMFLSVLPEMLRFLLRTSASSFHFFSHWFYLGSEWFYRIYTHLIMRRQRHSSALSRAASASLESFQVTKLVIQKIIATRWRRTGTNVLSKQTETANWAPAETIEKENTTIAGGGSFYLKRDPAGILRNPGTVFSFGKFPIKEFNFFDPEDWSDMFFWNVGWLSTGYTALYPKRQNSA
jgi:hypothetical protein